jgi:signal transduction histidine kinase
VECSFFDERAGKVLFLCADAQAEEDARQRLLDAVEEAKAASKAKSAFLANMSHEIRTPMNAIVGISEVLLRKELPQEVLESLSTIQNSGSSLLGIINDILDFSKIETGKFEITDVEYMLPSLLMDISNVISVRLGSTPVWFMMDIDPKLPNHFIGDDIRKKRKTNA